MKKSFTALAFLMVCGGATANLSAVMPSWQGEWANATGDRMVIYQSGPVLEVLGSDAASSYKLVCIVATDSATAQCVGDGINRKAKPYRFIYRSQMQIKGGSVAEQWDAVFDGGQAKGEVLFKPVDSAPKPQR